MCPRFICDNGTEFDNQLMDDVLKHEVFNLPAPHTNLSPQCKIDYKYVGVTYNKTQAIGIWKIHIQCAFIQKGSSTK